MPVGLRSRVGEDCGWIRDAAAVKSSILPPIVVEGSKQHRPTSYGINARLAPKLDVRYHYNSSLKRRLVSVIHWA